MTLHQFLPIPILQSCKQQRGFLRLQKHARQCIALQIDISNPTQRHRTRFRLLVQYGKESTLQVHNARFSFEPFRYSCDALTDERRLEGFRSALRCLLGRRVSFEAQMRSRMELDRNTIGLRCCRRGLFEVYR